MKHRLWLAIAISLAAPAAAPAAQPAAWTEPFEPFKIIGNLYYVGTQGLSAYLITGPRGHILVDGGVPESASMIAANIRKLGFQLGDVKYLLINHAHFDHSGGLAELKRLTGAKLVASAADKPDLEAGRTEGRPEHPTFPAVKVDRIIGDGEPLRLGSTLMVAHLTPGHTKGCTSWSLQAARKAVLLACSLTVAGQKLIGNSFYPDVVADYRSTFAKLRTMKADVFVNFHPEVFHMEEKRARQAKGEAEAFVDPGELKRQVDQAEKDFLEQLAKAEAERLSKK